MWVVVNQPCHFTLSQTKMTYEQHLPLTSTISSSKPITRDFEPTISNVVKHKFVAMSYIMYKSNAIGILLFACDVLL